jgi:hypothetical protein
MDGVVYFKVRRERDPEGGDDLVILLDGATFTIEVRLDKVLGFRLGQELIRTSKEMGIPADVVDQEVP